MLNGWHRGKRETTMIPKKTLKRAGLSPLPQPQAFGLILRLYRDPIDAWRAVHHVQVERRRFSDQGRAVDVQDTIATFYEGPADLPESVRKLSIEWAREQGYEIAD